MYCVELLLVCKNENCARNNSQRHFWSDVVAIWPNSLELRVSIRQMGKARCRYLECRIESVECSHSRRRYGIIMVKGREGEKVELNRCVED